MTARKIEHGDFFLLPYAGSRKSRLVKAVQPHPINDHWYVSNEAGNTSLVLLSSCHRCSPSVVRRILGDHKRTLPFKPRKAQNDHNPCGLTDRQIQAMDMMIRPDIGCSKKAAAKLGVAYTTINSLVRESQKKIGMQTLILTFIEWDRIKNHRASLKTEMRK